MKVCLIKPPILHKGVSFARFATPPLGLAYIAGALRSEGHQVQVIDASALGIDKVSLFKNKIYLFGLNKEEISDLIDEDTDVVCYSFMFTNNWLYDRELVRYVKNRFPRILSIAGGEHASALPEYSIEQSGLDFVVLGEGESVIVQLMHAIERQESYQSIKGIVYKVENSFINTGKQVRASQIENIVWPAWDLFPLNIYFENKMTYGVYRGNTLPVNATRGCPYQCTFCSSPDMWGRKYEMRPPKDFVDELEFLNKEYKVVNFDLYDLTAIIKKYWIVEMCREIIKRELNITYQLPSGTRAEAIDFEVAELLYQSGCKNITYAPESGSEIVLKDIKKKVKIDKMLESIKSSSKVGLNIKLNMIIGFPDEKHTDIWETLLFLIKCSWYGANDAAPAVFSPYPGSELFERLRKEGKIDPADDEYLYDIINTYDLMPGKIFSNHISAFAIKIYVYLFLLVFYGSNYLFRPIRLFRTLQNIFLEREESRIEQLVLNNFLKPLKLIFRG